MARQINGAVFYSPLCHLKYRFIKFHNLIDYERISLICPSPDSIMNISDKLKYFRHIKSLKQTDVADMIGINRTTYFRYEKSPENIPIIMLIKIASVLEVNPSELLTDEYSKFQLNNQGDALRAIRKSHSMTQHELAKCLGVYDSTIKRWESNKSRINRETYMKIMQLFKTK